MSKGRHWRKILASRDWQRSCRCPCRCETIDLHGHKTSDFQYAFHTFRMIPSLSTKSIIQKTSTICNMADKGQNGPGYFWFLIISEVSIYIYIYIIFVCTVHIYIYTSSVYMSKYISEALPSCWWHWRHSQYSWGPGRPFNFMADMVIPMWLPSDRSDLWTGTATGAIQAKRLGWSLKLLQNGRGA